MSEESVNTIISFLKQDQIKNMNMIHFMENNRIHSLERIGDSVLLRGESDCQWVYISSPNEDELSTVIDRLTEDDRHFALVEDWMLPQLLKDQMPVWQLSTMKLVLHKYAKIPSVSRYPIAPLTVDDARYVYENSEYQSVTSPEYIHERIRQGPSAGISVAGELVAWTMTHDDGAVGFLHVLEAHRRKGYSYALTLYMCHKLRVQGKMPYVHIEETNTRSMNLATKVGFVKDRRVHWFEI